MQVCIKDGDNGRLTYLTVNTLESCTAITLVGVMLVSACTAIRTGGTRTLIDIWWWGMGDGGGGGD